MIDYKKRKLIMGRSLRLGHCICNPKDPCPCETFKRRNICVCAAEREADSERDLPLTQFVENAGCASKINQEDLKKALSGLPSPLDPNVLVSADTCDDAGVYKLDEERALVQTVDVFTPVVDDAYLFGQVAAANSVSDVYAMGGRPLTALSILAFPVEHASPRLMNKMMQGGIDKLRESGAVLIGGHSIKDKEIKFGFAVTGLVHPGRIITNAKAKPGDVLILTKPIGTGIISFARQLGKAKPEWMDAIGRSMAALNKTAAEVMIETGVASATDVTGFGLSGHLIEMAVQSGVSVEVWPEAVPLFDGVRECLRAELVSGAIERNREYAESFISRDPALEPDLETVLYDPQTSGGMLMSVDPAKADDVLRKLHERGVEAATIIGRVVDQSSGRLVLKKR
jgi:selenide,water dikinase